MKKLFILSLLTFIAIASEKPHGQKRPAESGATSSEKKPFVPSSYPYPFAPKPAPSTQVTLATVLGASKQKPPEQIPTTSETYSSSSTVPSQVQPSQASSSSSSQSTQPVSSTQDLRYFNGSKVDTEHIIDIMTKRKWNIVGAFETGIKKINNITSLKNKYAAINHDQKLTLEIMLKEKETIQKELENINYNIEKMNKALESELPEIVQKKANELIEEQKNVALELARPRTPEQKPKE